MKEINEQDPQDGRARGVLHDLRDPGQPADLMADELDPDEIDALIAQQAAEAAGEAPDDEIVAEEVVDGPQPSAPTTTRRSRPTTSPS